MKEIRLALVYDFDKTLSPKDMQEFHYIPSLGYDENYKFWEECDAFAKENNCDKILSYMYIMFKKDSDLTREKLLNEGKYIELYKGVDTWFKRINDYGKIHNVIIEHYIISSGLTDMIRGTSIADEFKRIYACTFAYDFDGKVLWPSRVVNYTMKTQYLFRIEKGVLLETDDDSLNKSKSEKYIPIENMIYFGDGMTDVPSMKVVQQNGGTTIAVFDSKKLTAETLLKDKRATFAVKADYSEGSTIEKIVEGVIDSFEIKGRLEEYR